MTKWLTLLLLATAAFGVSAAPEETTAKNESSKVKATRIAVVDMSKLTRDYYRTEEMKAKLAKLLSEFNAELESMDKERQRYREEFNRLKEESGSIMISEAKRDSLRKDAQAMNQRYRDLEVKMLETKESNMRQHDEATDTLLKALMKDIRDTVSRRAMAEGYDIVLDLSSVNMVEVPFVIYSAPQTDITAAVLAELNKGQSKAAPRINDVQQPIGEKKP